MPNLPTLQQLRYLVSLAETLNFTRAAEACHVGQSTLSAGIQDLEGTLGVRLFLRGRRQVAITPQGQAALTRARDLLSGAADLTELVKLADHPMQGRLNLGTIPTLAPFQLPRILPALRRRYPGLSLSLREDLTGSLLGRLRDRRLDLALIALPHDTRGLLVRELFDEELWLVGRRGDALLKERRPRLDANAADRLILLEEGHCLREHSLRACGRGESSNGEGLEAASLLTLVQMVESGLGLALLPRMAVEAGLLRGTHLEGHPLAPPAPVRTIALVTRPSTPHATAFQKIGDIIVQCQSALFRAKTGRQR
jgi:LysR family hydrogen peroxide-inducible transcriptional activator